MGSPTNTVACCSYNILPAAAFEQCWQLLCFTAAVTASLADMALPSERSTAPLGPRNQPTSMLLHLQVKGQASRPAAARCWSCIPIGCLSKLLLLEPTSSSGKPAAAPAARINMSVGHASVQQVDHSAAQPSALAVHQAGRALSLLQRLLLLKVLIQHHQQHAHLYLVGALQYIQAASKDRR